MSLQYVEPTADCFPIGIFAKVGGGGTQRGKTGQGAAKPSFKKATKKAAKKKKK